MLFEHFSFFFLKLENTNAQNNKELRFGCVSRLMSHFCYIIYKAVDVLEIDMKVWSVCWAYAQANF